MPEPANNFWQSALRYFSSGVAIDGGDDDDSDRAALAKTFDFARAKLLYQQKGGWEGWLQCDLALALAGSGNPNVEREARAWSVNGKPLNQSCDVVYHARVPGEGLLIELKCDLEPVTSGAAVGTLATRWKSDIDRLIDSQPYVDQQYKSYITVAVAIAMTETVAEQLEALSESLPEQGSKYEGCYFKSYTIGEGGQVWFCFPCLPG